MTIIFDLNHFLPGGKERVNPMPAISPLPAQIPVSPIQFFTILDLL
jgi:hypothetical protein